MAKHSLIPSARRKAGRGGGTFLAAVLLCLALGLAGTPAASAHDQLVSSAPAAGERFSGAPAEISLTFNAPLLTLGYEVRVVDSSLRNWVQSGSNLNRNTLTQPLTEAFPDGEYQVRWRVVSSDGHPINGSYSFLVGNTAQLGSIPAPGTETGAARSPQPTTFPGPDEADHATGVPGWVIAAGIGAAAGLGLYVALGALQRRRRAATGA